MKQKERIAGNPQTRDLKTYYRTSLLNIHCQFLTLNHGCYGKEPLMTTIMISQFDVDCCIELTSDTQLAVRHRSN